MNLGTNHLVHNTIPIRDHPQWNATTHTLHMSSSTTHMITPHINRLLKLVESAPTSDHANEAAHLLGTICSTSAPSVMWEILGRLVLFLSSREWLTRENAAIAIHSVARCVPMVDQREFLTCDNNCSVNNDDGSNSYEWLTISKLSAALTDIIQHGKTLYARDDNTDNENTDINDDKFQKLDAVSRMTLQREILAKRLGLIPACHKSLLDDILSSSKDSDIPIINETSKSSNSCSSSNNRSNDNNGMTAAIERRKKRKREAVANSTSNNNVVLQSLLVNALHSKTSNTSNSNRVITIRQNLSQNILATEIIFHSMSGDWRARHGAMLGALYLFKAWCESNHTNTTNNNSNFNNDDGCWGVWTEDVLCRSIALLVLDQFNDFSHHTYLSDLKTSNTTTTTTQSSTSRSSFGITTFVTASTAPVREGAAQLMSYLYSLIPNTLEALRLSVWNILFDTYNKLIIPIKNNNGADDNDSWYRKHGALIGLKYLILINNNTTTGIEGLSKILKGTYQVLCSAIASINDEIVMEASAIFICILSSTKSNFSEVINIEDLLPRVMDNLSRVQPHSSHGANSLTLLSLIIERRGCSNTKIDLNPLIPTLIQSLAHFNHAIQLTALKCMFHALDDSVSTTNYNLVLQSVFRLENDNLFQDVKQTWQKLVGFGDKLDNAVALNLLLSFLKSSRIAISVHQAGLLQELMQNSQYFQNIISLLLHSEYIDAGLLLLLVLLEHRGIFRGMEILQDLHCLELVSFRQLLSQLFEMEYDEFRNKIAFSPKKKSTPLLHNLRSIRENNLISCCLVRYYYKSGVADTKFTPIIRPLINSIKNDTCLIRGDFTSRAIYTLLQMIPKVEIRNKVVRNIIEVYLAKCSGDVSEEKSVSADCLKYLVWHSEPSKLAPLYDYLFQLEIGAFHVYLAVLRDVVINDNTSDSNFIQFLIEQVPKVLQLSLVSSNSSMVILARSTVVMSSRIILSTVMDCLQPYLSDQTINQRVALLVTDLMNLHSTENLIPYVKTLLSFVFTNLAQCANLFGKLVTLAPLVPRTNSVSDDDKSIEKLIQHLIHGEPLPLVASPHGLKAELRLYQKECLSWLHFLHRVGVPGAICADEMGLGKTLQCLCSIVMSGYKTNLVICPSTLMSHWKEETETYFDEHLKCELYNSRHPPNSGLKSTTPVVLIVSYAQLRKDIDWFLAPQNEWGYVTLDEGHLIGNSKTATAKAIHRLSSRSKFRLILSGTPIQNCIEELFTLFEFIMPGYLGLTHSHFWNVYGRDIVKSQQSGANASQIQLGMMKLRRLHQAVLPFILRREKSSVLKELPPKLIQIITVKMSAIQQSLYESIVGSDQSKGVECALESIEQQIESDSTDGQKFIDIPKSKNTLQVILRLRLACTHPLLVYESYGKGEGDDLVNGNDNCAFESIDASGKLVALYELLREGLGIQSHAIDNIGVDGDESNIFIVPSKEEGNDISIIQEDEDLNCDHNFSKNSVEAIQDLEEPLRASTFCSSNQTPELRVLRENRKCLVFAQFTQSLDIVERFLFLPHMPSLRYLRLDGTVPPAQRSGIVRQFTDDPSIRVLLLTTKVGGLGLNLACADTVIFLEPSWNPHADIQAMDRVHRLGQKASSIHIYKLVTEKSIEEQIMRLQKVKIDMSNAVINTENSSMFSMGTDRLLDLFSVADQGSKEDHGRAESTQKSDDIQCSEWLDEQSKTSISTGMFLDGL